MGGFVDFFHPVSEKCIIFTPVANDAHCLTLKTYEDENPMLLTSDCPT